MTGSDYALRVGLIDTCRRLQTSGLTVGTSGNVSVRRDDRSILISPTGVAYDALTPEDVPVLAFDGRWWGRLKPSSEWRFHRDILRARTDSNAVVHTHSTHATALACRGEGIPAFHYVVAIAGGADIRCAPYRTFGTQALSDAALAALDGRTACLLSNHGVIALGRDLIAALNLAGEVENLATQYLAATGPRPAQLLDAAEMARVLDKFRSYGRQDADDDPELVFAGLVPP
ncbi:MAG: class II aldolase/adducin family protein [Rhodospirillaceae bacterium]|nr:class II aldolase/adducin family protein [Rhodospirillaceae bacterium]